MDYIDIYRKIADKNNREKLITVFKDTGEWDKLKIVHLEIIEDGKLPYILVNVDYNEDFIGYFSSAMIGIFMEKAFAAEIDTNYDKEYFYLPVIAKPCQVPEIAKKYFSEEIAVQHELMHLSDILEWISKEPEYIENAIRYSYESATAENIDKSIDFEVRKIFALEPQAIGNDFSRGEDIIIVPFLFDIFLKYKCRTKTEYIQMKMSDYITDLREMYLKNFSDRKDSVEDFFRKSVEKYGKKIFGRFPYDELKNVNKEKTKKMLKGSMEKSVSGIH